MRLRTLGAVCAIVRCRGALLRTRADPPPPGARRWPRRSPAPPDASAVHAAVMRRLVDRHVCTKRRHVRLLGERLSLQRAPRSCAAGCAAPDPGSGSHADARAARRHPRAAQAAERPLRRRARRADPGRAEGDRAVRVARQPAGDLGRRDVPRQVPVLLRHVAQRSAARATPPRASETEQDRRAAILYRRYGPGQWPVCGR